MTAEQRYQLIRKVENGLDKNLSIETACIAANTNKVWYWRWHHRLKAAIKLSLSDAPRSGRPGNCDASLRLSMAIEMQEKKIKTMEGILNAMRTNLATIKNTAFDAPHKEHDGDA